MGKSKVSFVVFGLTLMLIICILSIIAVAVSNSVTTFSNGLTTEQLNISSTNTTRYIDVPKYSYVNNLSVNVTTPNLKEVLWMKLNALDIRTNNNTIYNTIGTTGTVNGKAYNYGVYPTYDICYQEFANVSTACGGLASGQYSVTNYPGEWDGDPNYVFDGDYSTGAAYLLALDYAYIYINYTKPNEAINALWQVKDAAGLVNLSIPNSCFSSKLQFRIRTASTGTYQINWSCYNSTGHWITLRNISALQHVNEEAIFWNLTNLTQYKVSSSFAKFGSAGAGFDGDGDYINVSNENTFDMTGNFTIATWVKANSFLENAAIFDKWSSSGYMLTLKTSGGQNGLWLYDSDSAVSCGPLVENTWYHIVAVFNATHKTIFLDGVQHDTIADNNINNNNVVPSIGRYANGGVYFNGSLDNILIWNRSLSSTEVTALYNSQNYLNASFSNGLVLQYTFEKTNSTHVFDENGIVTGKWNESLSFDGVDDYVNLTNEAAYDLSNFSISTWIYINSFTENAAIFDKWSSSGYMLTLKTTGGNGLYLYDSDNALSNQNGELSNNRWYHVVAVFNNTHKLIYIDGYYNNAEANKDITNNNVVPSIGRYANGGIYFNGSIDDVMIFNSSLDSSQVRYLYEKQLDKYYPSNLNVYVGGTSAYSKTGSFNGSTIVAPNVNSILSNGCTCSGCSVVSTYTCRIPLDYYSDNQAYLINSLYNATYEWGVYNGSVGFSSNATALNFTVYDENNLTSLTLNSVVGTITINGQNFTTNYQNVNQFSVYIYPAWLNLSGDAYYQYTAGETERYYLRNISLSSQTGLINLYNFNGSDSNRYDLEYTTYNYFYSYYPNLIGKLQRYYPALNSWITVQIDQTDASGKLLYYIYLNSVDYRIRWEDDSGSLLYQTDPVKFICADGVSPCQDSDIIPRASESSNYDGMSWTPSYNNVTGIYSLSWTDSNNLVSSVTLLAQNENMDRVTTICNTTVESSSGTIVCNLSAYSGTITIRGIRTASPPNLYFLDTISKPIQQLYQILDSVGRTNDGIFLASLIQISFVGFGAMLGGAGCVLAGILGIIVISLFHLASFVTITLAVGITALGAVVMFIVKR